MGRLTAALLLAGCLCFQTWAQTPEAKTQDPAPAAAQNSAVQNSPAEPAPGNQPAASAKPTEPAAPNELPFHKFREFSATTAGSLIPGHLEEVHIYRSGDSLRTEDDTTRVHGYYVTNVAKQTSTGVAPNGGCVKLGYPYVRSFPFMLTRSDLKIERAAAGEETYDGHHCKIEDFKVTAAKSPPQSFHFKVWEADDLQGFPVKIENNIPGMKVWRIEYKNVALGPQDLSLFIVPNACQDTSNFKISKPATSGAKPNKAAGTKPQPAPAPKPQ